MSNKPKVPPLSLVPITFVRDRIQKSQPVLADLLTEWLRSKIAGRPRKQQEGDLSSPPTPLQLLEEALSGDEDPLQIRTLRRFVEDFGHELQDEDGRCRHCAVPEELAGASDHWGLCCPVRLAAKIMELEDRARERGDNVVEFRVPGGEE